MEKTKLAMILGLIAAILVIVAIFTPIYSSEINGESESAELYDETDEDEFRNTLIFAVIGLVGAILGSVGAYMVDIDKLGKKIGASLFGIGAAFSFIAPIYFWIDFTDNGLSDFWYSEEMMGVEVSSSPSIAWYLLFVAGIICIIGLVMAFKSEPTATRSSPRREQGTFEEEPMEEPFEEEETFEDY